MKKCWVKDADDRPGINTIARDLKRLVRVDSEPPVSLNISSYVLAPLNSHTFPFTLRWVMTSGGDQPYQ